MPNDTKFQLSTLIYRLNFMPMRAHTIVSWWSCLPPWSVFCPVHLLYELARHRLLCRQVIFPPSKLTVHTLALHMSYVSNSTAKFWPHSLRIGSTHFTLYITCIRILQITWADAKSAGLASCIIVRAQQTISYCFRSCPAAPLLRSNSPLVVYSDDGSNDS